MPISVVVGAQWGDEGKGRIVDLLSEKFDLVARYAGGDNAGHTVTVADNTFKLHLVPSGIIHSHTVGLLGNGMVINPGILLEEMNQLRQAGISISSDRLKISHAAHIITPGHIALDAAQERARGSSQIGTTKRGIGPAYTTKVIRSGLRMETMLNLKAFQSDLKKHLLEVNHQLEGYFDQDQLMVEDILDEYGEYAHILAPYIADVGQIAHQALVSGKALLAEGAQGTLLDIDHGTYPYVTSSTPTAPGALMGLGLGIGLTDQVIGVVKAFQTRVGEGPFPTEVFGDQAVRLRGTGENEWDEFGTTTGRPRRVGWLDIVLLRYAIQVNGISTLALTKLDILSGLDYINLCTSYQIAGKTYPDLLLGPTNIAEADPVYEELAGWEQDLRKIRSWKELPSEAREYVQRVETLTGVPARIISVGPERSQVIIR